MQSYISPNTPALFGQDDSATIQNAITQAELDGCRKIVIPRYNLRTQKPEWRIPRAIQIPSDFTVVLDNCHMVMETGVYDNMFTNSLSWSKEPRTLENEQHDITVIGEGNVCIDGGEHNGLVEKTAMRYGMPSMWVNTMFYWVNVRNLHVENIHVERHRWWAMTHLYCRHVKLKNLDFFAAPHVPNMDGIDLRVGCSDFEIENITGRTGDDTIALTALSGRHERACAVEGKTSHIHNVKIRNVLADPFLHMLVRILNQDGNQVYDIDLDTLFDVSDPFTKRKPKICVGIGTPGNVYTTLSHTQDGDTRNIYARNLTSRGSLAIRFDELCEDSTFTNVKTFGDNVLGIGTTGMGCKLKNILIDGFYYGSSKMLHPRGYSGNLEGYIDTIVDLPLTTGDITLKNVHVDGIRRLACLGDNITVEFQDSDLQNVETLCANQGNATLIIDGKEYKND